jgi:hypothetical protein
MVRSVQNPQTVLAKMDLKSLAFDSLTGQSPAVGSELDKMVPSNSSQSRIWT